ncbi:aminotransferase class III-fold pyridoxal phosphate-dependent enzyme [Vibrio metschnikovii]
MARSVGGGFPIGAMLTTNKLAELWKPVPTVQRGGNPLACAVGLAVVDIVSQPVNLSRCEAT